MKPQIDLSGEKIRFDGTMVSMEELSSRIVEKLELDYCDVTAEAAAIGELNLAIQRYG